MHYKLVLAYAGSGTVRSDTLHLINADRHFTQREAGRSIDIRYRPYVPLHGITTVQWVYLLLRTRG
jgi:hypothetical protein